jgi:hypothetical protein
MNCKRLNLLSTGLAGALAVWTMVFHGSSVLADQNWVPAGSGSWFLASNWSPAGVPNSTLIATVNNGGTAQANAPSATPVSASLLNVGKNGGNGHLTVSGLGVSVQGSMDVGDVDSLTAIGNVQLVSQGTVTLSNVPNAMFGAGGSGDLNVGQTSATSPAIARGTATFTATGIGTLQTAADFDVGQTAGSGNSIGDGTVNITDVTTRLQVGIDFDIGQTAGLPGSQNMGTGRVTITRAPHMTVGVDMDLAQATGDGRATGVGNLAVTDVDVTDIGTNLDIGKVRASGTAVNSASGTATWVRGNLNIGFGNAAAPGSLEISRVLASETAQGNSTSSLTLNGVDVDVANDIVVGQLDLGSSNPLSSAHGTLIAIDNSIRTRDLFIAQRLGNTSGAVTGKLQLTRSLANVQSTLGMSDTATLQLDIFGKVRADGSGGLDHYGAINADMASLDGILAIVTGGTYVDPASSGTVDSFLLVQSLFGMTGSFDAVLYNNQPLVPSFGSLASGFASYAGGGLFRIVRYDNGQVTLDNYRALPGDANGDLVVDGSDFGIWNANKFLSGTNWTTGDFNGDGVTDGSDFGIWNAFKFTSADRSSLVPEPAAAFWIVLAMTYVSFRSRRT